MESIFINEAFDSSIKEFIKLQKESDEVKENSFAIIVLKILACIYGDIDIINPYIVKNEKIFKQNLMKFGCSSELYEEFVLNFKDFFKIDEHNKVAIEKKENPYFVDVQKNLIDIFMCKKKNYKVSEEEEKAFFGLLYTSETEEPLKLTYNHLTAKNPDEVEFYYYQQLDALTDDTEPPRKSNILNLEAYEILNYSLTDIANMDADSVDEVNERIYSFFEIDEDVTNKNELLNAAIDNYKKYNSKLTSGNGYVDILLVMGIVVTGILVLTVASFIIF